MTVANTDSRWEHIGDGVATSFAFGGLIFAASDLFVYVDGVEQTLTADYSVTGVNNEAGGAVVFGSAPTGKVMIVRNVPIDQRVSFPEANPIPSKVWSKGLDKLTVICQQLFDSLARTMRMSASSSYTGSLTLPDPVANRGLKWAADGQSLTNSDGDPDAAVQYAAAAAQSAGAAVGAAESADTALEEIRELVGEAGWALRKDSNLSDVPDKATARDNLGVTEAISEATQAATTDRAGLAELATNAETVAGLDASRTVTPAGLAAALTAQTKVFAYGGLKTASFTVAAADMFKRFRIAPAAAMTVTLPAPVAGGLVLLGVENGSYTITLAAASAATKIYFRSTTTAWASGVGPTALGLVVGEVWLWSDGVDWWVVMGTGTQSAVRYYSRGDGTKTGAVYSNTGFKLANGTDIGTLFTAYGSVCNCQCDCGGP